MRNYLKKIAVLKAVVAIFRRTKNQHSLVKKLKLIASYLSDYRKFKKLTVNGNFRLDLSDWYPCVYDKTETTPIDAVYFLQDAWYAKKIFENRPATHFDIASKAETVAIISQFTPTTMIDIRPVGIKLDGLSFKTGDILSLPFKDNEISSLGSICVIEHIGLGRYGDTLDQFGSEKAAAEMIRVLANGGYLYITVPVDSENKIYFNAHRAFTREYVLGIFKPLTLLEEKYIYHGTMHDKFDLKKGFGTGLFMFQKRK